MIESHLEDQLLDKLHDFLLELGHGFVGILLCTQKDHALVEYALAGIDNGLFVSKYMLELPKQEDMQRFIEEHLVGGGSGAPEKLHKPGENLSDNASG